MPSDARYKTLCEVLETSVRTHSSRQFLGAKTAGSWRWTTYGAFDTLVDRMRGGLASLGVKHGDRVSIVSNNRLEWAVVAFACYTLGAVFVPMYEAQSVAEWEFIVRESEASVLFVANEVLFERARSLLNAISSLNALVVLSGQAPVEAPIAADGKRIATYVKLLEAPAASRRNPSPNDVAVLIYTSGTTGTPKGVVLTHLNIASNLSAIREVFSYTPGDRSLSFLPWAHIFGQTSELYLLMSCGSSIAICEGPEKIFENLREVRPTVLITVPRVFNRIYIAAQQELASRPKAIQSLVASALDAGARKRRGHLPRAHERLLQIIADRLVFKSLRARFGGRLRMANSGGAALSPEVATFVDSIGIEVYEGYGLTEASPVVATNVPGARRTGSVGRPLPGVRVVIERDSENPESLESGGEIVVYGTNVMRGYWKRSAETAEALTVDGGLRTGDVGQLDADGYLFLTGRIKEQYKLENGKYVVPSPLEELLKLSPYVSNVMVCGEHRPFNVALVVPNVAAIAQWAQTENLTFPSDVDAMLVEPRVRALLEQELARCSAAFKGYETIGGFALIGSDFTVANGMLTPKLSLRRARVMEAYADVIAALYRSGFRRS
jgi:long-chain acyl-CoA synthetase